MFERKSMKAPLIFVAVALFSVAIQAKGISAREITAEESKALALAALSADERKLPDLGVEPPGKSDARYWLVTVTWAGPSQGGSVVVENYSVDSYTGDVFAASASCDEIKNDKLVVLQKKIRARLHLSDADYKKVKTNGPMC